MIQRILDINNNSRHKQDGIVALKIIIAMLENLQNKIDDALPHIIKIISVLIMETL